MEQKCHLCPILSTFDPDIDRLNEAYTSLHFVCWDCQERLCELTGATSSASTDLTDEEIASLV